MDHELQGIVAGALEQRGIPRLLHDTVRVHVLEHVGEADRYGTRVLLKSGSTVAANQVQYVVDDLIDSKLDQVMTTNVDQKVYEAVRLAGAWPRKRHG